jgi:hypothetical protein
MVFDFFSEDFTNTLESWVVACHAVLPLRPGEKLRIITRDDTQYIGAVLDCDLQTAVGAVERVPWDGLSLTQGRQGLYVTVRLNDLIAESYCLESPSDDIH